LYDTFLPEVILCKKIYRKRQTTFIILLVGWNLEETYVLTLMEFSMSKHIMVMACMHIQNFDQQLYTHAAVLRHQKEV
jgi:hypothetical protein